MKPGCVVGAEEPIRVHGSPVGVGFGGWTQVCEYGGEEEMKKTRDVQDRLTVMQCARRDITASDGELIIVAARLGDVNLASRGLWVIHEVLGHHP
jgi:hypothetical protein